MCNETTRIQSSIALQWRHNVCDSVSKHQPHDCLLNHLFRRRSKKTSKVRVTGRCEGILPATGEFPTQRASNAENVSIWWRHHGNLLDQCLYSMMHMLYLCACMSQHEHVCILKLSRPSYIFMSLLLTRLLFVQIMACRLFSARPLLAVVLIICHLDTEFRNRAKFESEYPPPTTTTTTPPPPPPPPTHTHTHTQICIYKKMCLRISLKHGGYSAQVPMC